MKQIILFAAAIVMVGVLISEAWAACPPGTRYDCYTTANGKQSCGCR